MQWLNFCCIAGAVDPKPSTVRITYIPPRQHFADQIQRIWKIRVLLFQCQIRYPLPFSLYSKRKFEERGWEALRSNENASFFFDVYVDCRMQQMKYAATPSSNGLRDYHWWLDCGFFLLIVLNLNLKRSTYVHFTAESWQDNSWQRFYRNNQVIISFLDTACQIDIINEDIDRYSFFRMAPGRPFFINVHIKFEYGCDRYESITAPW